MKLLCVDCDDVMSLVETRGPMEGSMTVIFECSDCGRKTAMLTNAMETQVVRSLGVKIGGRTASHEPMEAIRGGLSTHSEESSNADAPAASTEQTESDRSDSSCPFTGMVEDAYEENAREENAPEELQWTEAARDRLNRIPSMARSMARRSIEEYAREEGYTTIDETVMDAIKGRFGF